jgi:hypothetical protein
VSCKMLTCWQNPDVHNRNGKGSQFNPVVSPSQSVPHLIFPRSFLAWYFCVYNFMPAYFRRGLKQRIALCRVYFLQAVISTLFPYLSQKFHYKYWGLHFMNCLCVIFCLPCLFISLWWWYFFLHSPAKSSLCSLSRVKCYAPQSCR